jgi:hypothetical protein
MLFSKMGRSLVVFKYTHLGDSLYNWPNNQVSGSEKDSLGPKPKESNQISTLYGCEAFVTAINIEPEKADFNTIISYRVWEILSNKEVLGLFCN